MDAKQKWLRLFFESMPKCKWFIVEYFGKDHYNHLLQLGKEGNVAELITNLNYLHFKLPDSFNIRNTVLMDDGWREFLELLEFKFDNER